MLHGRCHLHPCEKSRVEKCLFPAKLMALITSSASQLPKQIAALLGLSKANRLTDLNSHLNNSLHSETMPRGPEVPACVEVRRPSRPKPCRASGSGTKRMSSSSNNKNRLSD